MGIYGEDWASYQSATPSTSGLAFFFTKVTEGLGYENPLWRSQYNHGVGAGLVPGKYHYPHMGNSVQAEGDRFLSLADVQAGDMVCLDWEGYDTANQGVPKSQQAAYKDAWLRYVKGKLPSNKVGMYCNADYWRNVDVSGFYGDFLWIATAGLPAGQPGITAPWLFHQYSAASVDKDYCHLSSLADLKAWASPSGGDMPLTDADVNLIWGHTESNANGSGPVRMGAVMAWMDKVHAGQSAAISAVATAVAGLATSMTAVTAAVAKLGTTDAAILADLQAAQTALAGIPAQVETALKDGTVHVDVSVTGPAAPATP